MAVFFLCAYICCNLKSENIIGYKIFIGSSAPFMVIDVYIYGRVTISIGRHACVIAF